MDELERRIRHLIVETLNLEDIAAEGLCLDSIDALEIGVEIQKTFGIKVDPQDENLADYFASVRELARFITRQKGLQEQAI